MLDCNSQDPEEHGDLRVLRFGSKSQSHRTLLGVRNKIGFVLFCFFKVFFIAVKLGKSLGFYSPYIRGYILGYLTCVSTDCVQRCSRWREAAGLIPNSIRARHHVHWRAPFFCPQSYFHRNTFCVSVNAFIWKSHCPDKSNTWSTWTELWTGTFSEQSSLIWSIPQPLSLTQYKYMTNLDVTPMLIWLYSNSNPRSKINLDLWNTLSLF